MALDDAVTDAGSAESKYATRFEIVVGSYDEPIEPEDETERAIEPEASPVAGASPVTDPSPLTPSAIVDDS